MSPHLYVISGPSGVGKSTVIDRLRARIEGLGYSISHTSREPRENEKDGVHYHFVDRETFSRMIDDGAFIEWAQVYSDYYGTSYTSIRSQLDQGMDIVMDLDSQGAMNVKKAFMNTTLIYILPPSLEELDRRLRGRGTDDEEVIRARFKKAVKELNASGDYDYIVFNDKLQEAVSEVEAIIISERCRKANRFPTVKKIFKITTSG